MGPFAVIFNPLTTDNECTRHLVVIAFFIEKHSPTVGLLFWILSRSSMVVYW